MSAVRIRKRPSRSKPRTSYRAKPVSLPTFAFYQNLPVVYVDGELVIGRRVIPMERRS